MKHVIIDLSNVCCSQGLGELENEPQLRSNQKAVRWSRYLAVRDAWRALFPDQCEVYAIADRSLGFLIDRPEELRKAIACGEVYLADGDADYAVLEQARYHAAKVLTKDYYRDIRDHETGAWVQGNTDSFYEWRGTLKTGVRIVSRDMGTAGENTILKARERAIKKAMGSATPEPEAQWICIERTCRNFNKQVILPHRTANGETYCSSCGRLLENQKQGFGRAKTVAHLTEDHLEPTPSERRHSTANEEGRLKHAAWHSALDSDSPPHCATADPADPPEESEETFSKASHAPESPDLQSPPPDPPDDSPLCIELHFDHRIIGAVSLVEGRRIILGREVDDPAVTNITQYIPRKLGQEISRKHIELTLRNGKVSVRDLSRYGTWLNGQRLKTQDSCLIQLGDKLGICKNIVNAVLKRTEAPDARDHDAPSHSSSSVERGSPEQQPTESVKESGLIMPSNIF